MPAAFQMAKKNETSPSVFLMPMSFASLLGGLMTLVGTSPNIIVSRVRAEMIGEPFHMFDYTPVGLGLLLVGLVFLRFGYRLLPRDRRGAASLGEAIDTKGYITESTITEDSPAIDETVADFIERHDHEITVTSVLRAGMRSSPYDHTLLRERDTLILGGEPDVLDQVIAADKLELAGHDREMPENEKGEEVGVIEAVLNSDSPLVGQTAGRLRLQERYGVNLIAVSRRGERLIKSLGKTVLQGGDVVVLQGALKQLPDKLRDLGCLPLAQRQIKLGASRRTLLPIAILAVAMAATATGLIPVAVAFFAAAGLTLVTGALPVRDAYDNI